MTHEHEYGRHLTCYCGEVNPDYQVEEIAAPASRDSDPETSHKAADWLERSGQRQTQKRAVLEYLVAHPTGWTYGELEGYLKIRGVWKRISDLANDALIYADGTRVWPETGAAQRVWWAA